MATCILCREPTDNWPMGTPYYGIWVYLCHGCRHEPDWVAIKRRMDYFIGEIVPIERNTHIRKFALASREVIAR